MSEVEFKVGDLVRFKRQDFVMVDGHRKDNDYLYKAYPYIYRVILIDRNYIVVEGLLGFYKQRFELVKSEKLIEDPEYDSLFI